jgi:hypothetical protein
MKQRGVAVNVIKQRLITSLTSKTERGICEWAFHSSSVVVIQLKEGNGDWNGMKPSSTFTSIVCVWCETGVCTGEKGITQKQKQNT